jgi:predicted membrane channel-forming protein YqfA (hemolysin III family)
MSQTYISIVVMVLASILPRIGISLGNEELTTFVSVVLTIGAGIWALIRRYQAGGIKVSGVRK